MSAFILFWHTAAMATFQPKSNLRVFRSENCFYKVDGEGREKAEKWSPREKRAALAAEILYFLLSRRLQINGGLLDLLRRNICFSFRMRTPRAGTNTLQKRKNKTGPVREQTFTIYWGYFFNSITLLLWQHPGEFIGPVIELLR